MVRCRRIETLFRVCHIVSKPDVVNEPLASVAARYLHHGLPWMGISWESNLPQRVRNHSDSLLCKDEGVHFLLWQNGTSTSLVGLDKLLVEQSL